MSLLDDSDYETKNNKLDAQLYKLRKAKMAMSSLFNDMDSLLDQTGSYQTKPSGLNYSNYSPYSSSSSELSSDELAYLNDSLRYAEPSGHEIVYIEKPPSRKKPSAKKFSTKKPPLPAGNLQFSHTLPTNFKEKKKPAHQIDPIQHNAFLSNLIENLTSLSLQVQPGAKNAAKHESENYYSEYASTRASRKPSVSKNIRPNSASMAIPRSSSASSKKRPPWRGSNGEKLNNQLSSSTTSLNRPLPKNSEKVTNPVFSQPWRPTNKSLTRSNSNLYLSSTSLNKSTNFDR
jgi:hypothetical protein